MSFNLKRDMGVTLPEPKVAAAEPKQPEIKYPCPQCEGVGIEESSHKKCRRCSGAGFLQKRAQIPPPKAVNPANPANPADPFDDVEDMGDIEWDGQSDASTDVDIPSREDLQQEPPEAAPVKELAEADAPINAPEDTEKGFSVSYEQPTSTPSPTPENAGRLISDITAIVRGSFDKVVANIFDFVADTIGLNDDEKLAASSSSGKTSVRAMTNFIYGRLNSLSPEQMKKVYEFARTQ